MARPTPVRGLVAATPMTRAAQVTLQGRSGDLRRHLAKLRRTVQSDAIHDARVAARRPRRPKRVRAAGAGSGGPTRW